MPVSAIVLAAGEATRMRSNRPKPLHLICGRPMVLHVLHALEGLDVQRTVMVVGTDAERVSKRVQEQAPAWANVTFVEQQPGLGTADATAAALAAFDADDHHDDTSTVVVLPGHVPLVQAETISTLVARHEASGYAATVLTTQREDPTGHRRVVRAAARHGEGQIVRLVGQRDAAIEGLDTHECSASIYAFRRDLLVPALRRIEGGADSSVAAVVEVLAAMGHRVGSVAAAESEVRQIDDRWQLAMAERELRARTNRSWLLNGVTMLDPRQTFIDVTVTLGRDVTLFPGTILQGRTVIGDGCEIGPDTRLVDCVVGEDCVVQNTVGAEAEIGAGARVGPFAHLAPGCVVAEGAVSGPFYTGRAE